MGFEAEQAKAALEACGSVEAALEALVGGSPNNEQVPRRAPRTSPKLSGEPARKASTSPPPVAPTRGRGSSDRPVNPPNPQDSDATELRQPSGRKDSHAFGFAASDQRPATGDRRSATSRLNANAAPF